MDLSTTYGRWLRDEVDELHDHVISPAEHR